MRWLKLNDVLEAVSCRPSGEFIVASPTSSVSIALYSGIRPRLTERGHKGVLSWKSIAGRRFRNACNMRNKRI